MIAKGGANAEVAGNIAGHLALHLHDPIFENR